ncbi:MAG: hypothetical protein ABR608_05260 [Pseudonocardiaceae bacterium]
MGGYRVELPILRRSGRGLCDLADEVRDSIDEPLAPSAGGNEGFASVQSARTVAEAWETETGNLVTVLWTAGDQLAKTAEEYDQADASGAHGFQRILRGG